MFYLLFFFVAGADSDSDHHYETLRNSENEEPEVCYDSFASDIESDDSFENLVSRITNRSIPRVINIRKHQKQLFLLIYRSRENARMFHYFEYFRTTKRIMVIYLFLLLQTPMMSSRDWLPQLVSTWGSLRRIWRWPEMTFRSPSQG